VRRSVAAAVAIGCVLVGTLAGCGRSEGAQRGRRGQPPEWAASRPSYPPGADIEKVTIEFDVTPEMTARGADGRFAVPAFQVGYFDGSRLVRALEVPRAAWRVDGKRVAIDLPKPVQDRATPSSMSIRVRALASIGALGAWSQAAVSIDALPPEDARARRRPDGAEPRAQRPQLTMADVDALPRLKEAVTEQLKGQIPIADAVVRFRNVRELAQAVTISRKLQISFPKLCEAMLTARGFTDALQRVGPSGVNLRAELNSARGEAVPLVKPAK
jgi:hypothetical protein